MMYFMTAFFLTYNHASPLWWGGFIGVAMIEAAITFVKWDMKNE